MFEDHFNWPSANKTDTMYLSTIRNQEPGVQKRSFTRDRSANLDISDIEKAKPYYQGYQYTQKETFANRNDDIAGSRPKKLHQPLEKVYYGLRNDDIAGTKPQSHKFVTTRVPINPLTPEYKLPQVEIRVPSPPKFVRDNIDIKDIEGAKPNPYTRYNIQRKTNQVEDIDGAKPKKEWIPEGKPSSLDVRDINYFWEFHTKRQTDPLSPRYKVVSEDNKLVEYGQLDNKATIRHPKDVNKVTSSDLRTGDIDGAQASTSVQKVNGLVTRDTFMKTQDIPGAQIATLKKGMSTLRQTNPIWPAYRVPGHSEPPPVYTKNLGNSQKFAGQTGSDFSASKSGLNTQAEKAWAHHNQIVGSSQAGETVGFAERMPSEKSAAIIAPTVPEKALSGFARNGGEVVNSSKVFAERSEYVPARTVGDSSDAVKKTISKGTSFEAKKISSGGEVSGLNEKKGFKSLSAAEKFDKFIN